MVIFQLESAPVRQRRRMSSDSERKDNCGTQAFASRVEQQGA